MIDHHNIITDDYFEVVALFPERSSDRKPRNWKHIQGSLTCIPHDTPLGLTLTIQTKDIQEAVRIKKMIWSHSTAWSKHGGGVANVEIWETQIIKRGRRVDDADERIQTAAAYSDSMHKRLYALAHGVPFTEDMVEDDRLVAEEKRRQRALAEERTQELRLQYSQAKAALNAGNVVDYQAAVENGETRKYAEWIRHRPDLPPFEDWQQRLAAGEEPSQLLLTAAAEPEDVHRQPSAERQSSEEQEQDALTASAEEDVFAQLRATQVKAAKVEMAESAYKDVWEFFVNESEAGEIYTFQDVVREARAVGRQHEEELVREALNKLISKGIVRESERGFDRTDADVVGDEDGE